MEMRALSSVFCGGNSPGSEVRGPEGRTDRGDKEHLAVLGADPGADPWAQRSHRGPAAGQVHRGGSVLIRAQPGAATLHTPTGEEAEG